MSELGDFVYPGGSMTPEEWMALEMDAKEMQGWNLERPDGFDAVVSGYEFHFEYHNTRAFVFDGDYFWMSFIHHRTKDRGYYLRPGETEETSEKFMILINEIIKRGFKFRNEALPTNEALNMTEREIMAACDIADLIPWIELQEEAE